MCLSVLASVSVCVCSGFSECVCVSSGFSECVCVCVSSGVSECVSSGFSECVYMCELLSPPALGSEGAGLSPVQDSCTFMLNDIETQRFENQSLVHTLHVLCPWMTPKHLVLCTSQRRL